VDPQAYLKYLFSRFTGNGGSVVRGFVQHINQVIAGDSHVFPGSTSTFPPDVLVVCAGIGARSLGGVDDQDVFPIRGQSVVLKAPWVEFGCAVNAFDSRTYVFPRSNGYVSDSGDLGLYPKYAAGYDRWNIWRA
jgi:D-amino-acid oxidase